jgi:hypothetical protein
MPRRAVTALLVSVAAAAILPAAAGAQDPPAPSPPAPPPASPTPAPTPAPGRMSLAVERTRPAPLLAGDPFRVRATVRPYVAGQQVTVRVLRRGRRLAELRAPVLPAAGGRAGVARVPFATKVAGRLSLRAVHGATPQQVAFRARPRAVRVRPWAAGPGSRGRVVRVLQRGLRRLGYVVGRRGRYDDRTARAVLAFRKVLGLARTTQASPGVFARLAAGRGRFRVRFPSHGKHAEADLSRQVLALVRGRRVERIYPISSGASVTPTILGSFRVYLKTPGTNSLGMVHSSYFIRGYAVHGYASVPTYPASHGCLRVPTPDAWSIYRWLDHGVRVDVYP